MTIRFGYVTLFLINEQILTDKCCTNQFKRNEVNLVKASTFRYNMINIWVKILQNITNPSIECHNRRWQDKFLTFHKILVEKAKFSFVHLTTHHYVDYSKDYSQLYWKCIQQYFIVRVCLAYNTQSVTTDLLPAYKLLNAHISSERITITFNVILILCFYNINEKNVQ